MDIGYITDVNQTIFSTIAILTPPSPPGSPSLSASPLKDTPSTTETAAITAREVPINVLF